MHEILLFAGDVVEEFPSLTIFHHQKKILGSLDDLVELYKVGVSDQLQDVYLSADSLDI